MVRTKIGPGPGKYLLPPLVGYKDHDASRYRNPQYSMAPRLNDQTRRIGPGPSYNTEHMTPYGKASPPAYSLATRNRPLKAFQGPGPATYNLQNAPRMKEQRPPEYSMRSRYSTKFPFQIPAPNQYELPTTIGPKVPDKNAKPAFTMSDRTPLLNKAGSPGPARYDPTSPDIYKNKNAKYSMSIKHNDLKDRFPNPGPSAYYPKPPTKGGISFGLKTEQDPYITPTDDMPCINK